ncbi:MAG: hypothetical protein NC417_08755 [Candidatus Gastranaerophilales bacterium]|nr:hypothetical protein [Candidatus Gastranaerophilales bacterium]
MRNKFTKRMLALVLPFLMIFSMTFVSSAENDAIMIAIDGNDAGSEEIFPDGVWDTGDVLDAQTQETGANESVSADGSDMGLELLDAEVSGSGEDVGQALFVVTDGDGTEFGKYGSWADLLAAFKQTGNPAEEYLITVSEEGIIGASMPGKAGRITLRPAQEGGTLKFASATVNLATATAIEAAVLETAKDGKPVNINTKGKSLTLRQTKHLGAVKGSSSGSLTLEGDIRTEGALQTFKTVTVQGSLYLGHNMTGVANLNLENGTVYPASGRTLTVANVTAGESGTLVYPGTGALPTVKITGAVSGVLSIRQYAEDTEEAEELYFAAGTKLLTASKAKAEQFAVFGDKRICYKKGSAVYVGAEVLQLYAQEEYLGTYAQWSDVVSQINGRRQKGTAYRVVLLDDFTVNGTLSMPGKGKYAGIAIENGASGRKLALRVTGNVTLTADLNLGTGLDWYVKGLSGASWKFTMENGSGLTAGGAVTVGTLSLGEDTFLQADGNFTVKKLLEAEEGAHLVLTQKKKAALKDSMIEGGARVTVSIRDKNDNRVTLSQGTTLFTLSGSSYATQYRLLDGEGKELALYRKGNALKVQGSAATPVTLYDVAEDGEVSLGEYASLADVKTEIARRKNAKGSYRLEVAEDLFVKGAIPFPKAGTYKEITFTGARIRTTGNLTLTGGVTFANEVRKVKNEKDDKALLWTVNLSKYTLTIPAGSSVDSLGSVKGSTGSCLRVEAGAEQTINGDLKAAALTLGGRLQVTGNVTVTEICPEAGNRFVYDLAKNVTVKGDITGDGTKLLLDPLKNGQALSVYTEGQKILSSMPKANINRLKLAQETEYTLYRENGAVKLGTPIITVFADTLDYESCIHAASSDQPRFVRVNDAMDYINDTKFTEYVIRLDQDVPSAGNFTMPSGGKHIVLCGIGGEQKTLALSGSLTLDGSSLTVRNVKLDNKTAAEPGVTLKNNASLYLYETGINTLNAAAGTAVTLEGQVELKGAVSGACDLTVAENAVVRVNGNLTAGTLTLAATPGTEGRAQFRISSGKKITINGKVDTGGTGLFLMNVTDKNDALADLKEGTVLVNTQYGEAGQFSTENIIPGTFEKWTLTKEGTAVKTKADAADDGQWSGDYL